jgi:hypothetical protein
MLTLGRLAGFREGPSADLTFQDFVLALKL